MPDETLVAPGSNDELYLARGDELVPARPVLTGDVFTNVEIDADDHDGLVMVVAHPCSMRGARGRLLPRIVVAPIRNHQDVAFKRWPTGFFKVMPLPGLHGDQDQSRAVQLLELSAVRSTELTRDRRIASLSNLGIHVLQQRLVFCLTRVAVGLDKLEEQVANVLLEAELEEEWVDDLSADDAEEGALVEQTSAFAAFMDDGHREALKDPTRRTDTTRAVRKEIRRRKESES
ncbi:MAG: hypothetical protein WKF96_12460 [Solirubrobacteraceae bacterium]